MNFLALSRQEVRLHHHSLRGIEKPIYYTIKKHGMLIRPIHWEEVQ